MVGDGLIKPEPVVSVFKVNTNPFKDFFLFLLCSRLTGIYRHCHELQLLKFSYIRKPKQLQELHLTWRLEEKQTDYDVHSILWDVTS